MCIHFVSLALFYVVMFAWGRFAGNPQQQQFDLKEESRPGEAVNLLPAIICIQGFSLLPPPFAHSESRLSRKVFVTREHRWSLASLGGPGGWSVDLRGVEASGWACRIKRAILKLGSGLPHCFPWKHL